MFLSEHFSKFIIECSSLSLWLLILVAIGSVFILNFIIGCIQQKRLACRQVEGFPTPPGHWLRGHLGFIAGQGSSPLKYFKKCANEFKTAYALWVGPLTSRLVLCHPDTIKVVQSSNAPKAANQATRFLKPFLGDGLVVSGGGKWFKMRRLLTPAFHIKVLKGYLQVFHESTTVLLEKWSFKENSDVELFSDLSLMTLDSILKTAFSYHSNCQLQESRDPYFVAVGESVEQLIARQLNPLLHNDLIYKSTSQGKKFFRNCALVQAKAKEVLTERRRDIRENICRYHCLTGISNIILQVLLSYCHRLRIAETEKQETARVKKHVDFLDALIEARDENGSGLTDKDIIDEVTTFMFAGHDTTASALSWALYCLARFNEHRVKCQQEIDDVFCYKDELDWQDLGNLPFLHMCIKEAMRLYPPAPVIGRTLDKAYEIDGRLVPEGTWVMVNIYALHHSLHVWQDPEKFDPFRFTMENSEDRPPFAFIPFAAGPRNCIGQGFAMAEIKLTMAMILRKYDLSLQPKHIIPEEDLQAFVILRAKNGIIIHISPRNK